MYHETDLCATWEVSRSEAAVEQSSLYLLKPGVGRLHAPSSVRDPGQLTWLPLSSFFWPEAAEQCQVGLDFDTALLPHSAPKLALLWRIVAP